jgi:hypothetical protein
VLTLELDDLGAQLILVAAQPMRSQDVARRREEQIADQQRDQRADELGCRERQSPQRSLLDPPQPPVAATIAQPVKSNKRPEAVEYPMRLAATVSRALSSAMR